MRENAQEFGLVSVVMPSYNSEDFIAESIKSVQSQTYGDWELLIVDDCSTDGTVAVAEAIAMDDSRVHVFSNERNSGAACSRNRALREAKGDWIAFLDSDDLWGPDKLERQLAFMRKSGCSFSYTEYETMDEGGESQGRRFSGPALITHSGMRRYCWPGCLTVMYDAHEVGLVQIADLKKHNDYAMWLKAAKKADCMLLPEVLGRYRVRTSSVSHGVGLRGQVAHLYVLWHEGEGMCASLACWRTFINLVFGAYKKMKYVNNCD